MDFFYCPKCGEKLSEKQVGDEGLLPFCGECDRPWFPFSYPCVICLVINEFNEIALIRQTYATKNFICVAGFIANKETPEHAAVREIKEEIGLDVQELCYVNSYYYKKTDCLMLGFAARVKKAEFKLSPNEIETAKWFSIDKAAEELAKGATGKDLLRDWLIFNKSIQ